MILKAESQDRVTRRVVMQRFVRQITIRNLGIALGMIMIYHFWHLHTPHIPLVPDVRVNKPIPGNDTAIGMTQNVPGGDTTAGKLQTTSGDNVATAKVHAEPESIEDIQKAHTVTRKDTGICKVSMLYGAANAIYDRAVRAHARHGYPTQVLRHEIISGYWNKPSYLLAVLIMELAKLPEERLKWLLWFDADSILINPKIPLEIFLPPPDFDHINFLTTKDHNGLNTGVFFMRVDPWSVTFLTKSMGLPMFRADIDLGFSIDQEAMANVFQESEYGYARIYQPRQWFNTYEFDHGYEGKKGNMLVHFPGLGDRWNHMSRWLDTIEQNPEEWEVELSNTTYQAEIDQFWSALREGKKALDEAEQHLKEHPSQLSGETGQGVEEMKMLLQEAMSENSDDPEAVSEATGDLRQAIRATLVEVATSPEAAGLGSNPS